MTDRPTRGAPRARLSLLGVAAAVVGTALFVFYVRRVGLGEIADDIQRLGWGFLGIVALGGFRFAARGMAWRSCVRGSHRLGPWLAFRAVVAGDTVGNVVTLLSVLVSEPAKALFARDSEPVARTLPALAVENLFYALSAAFVIASGGLALAFRLRTSEVRWLVGVALVVVTLIVLVAVAHAIIWKRIRVASGFFDLLERRRSDGGLLSHWSGRVRRVEDRIYGLYPREPRRLARLAGWELTFHALAVLEVYVVLSLISAVTPTALDAFLLESTNRFIQVAFKVVPMRIGVDEAGTATFAELLAFGSAAGVTLAIVRKARQLVWMAVGGGFLLSQGLSVNRIIAEAETARAGDDVSGHV
jgi:hypothetical protein